MSLHSKSVAVVTGASSGIGLELAKILASEGYDLIISSGNRAKLKTTRGNVKIIVVDLSKAAGPKKLYDAVKKLGRRVDVLVNNPRGRCMGRFCKRNGTCR